MSRRPIMYVHAGDYSEFLQYQQQVPDIECQYITDGEFLRARTPAPIKVLPFHFKKWDSQYILESIETHQRLWSQELEERRRKQEEGDEELYF